MSPQYSFKWNISTKFNLSYARNETFVLSLEFMIFSLKNLCFFYRWGLLFVYLAIFIPITKFVPNLLVLVSSLSVISPVEADKIYLTATDILTKSLGFFADGVPLVRGNDRRSFAQFPAHGKQLAIYRSRGLLHLRFTCII